MSRGRMSARRNSHAGAGHDDLNLAHRNSHRGSGTPEPRRKGLTKPQPKKPRRTRR